MGLDYPIIRFLNKYMPSVRGGSVLTLGLQDIRLSGVERTQIKQDSSEVITPLDVFRRFGYDSLSAMDASSYEGADVIFDLNSSVLPDSIPRFDCIVDGGTLEHIYNCDCAFKNVDRLLNDGGILIIYTPINNFCGHGFYQFTPELIFRRFSSEYGFSVLTAACWEYTGGYPSWLINDPKSIGWRVEFSGIMPMNACFIIRKNKTIELVESPQQSDYKMCWASGVTNLQNLSKISSRNCFNMVIEPVRKLALNSKIVAEVFRRLKVLKLCLQELICGAALNRKKGLKRIY